MSDANINWDDARIRMVQEGMDDAELRIEIGDGINDTIYIGGNKDGLAGGGTPDGMTITGAGNVGIGTVSPQAELDVVGDISVSGNIKANYPTANNQVSLCIQCFWGGPRRLTGDGGDADDYYVCCKNGCITKFGYFHTSPWTCP